MKFIEELTLSNKQIKANRAKMICEDAKDAQEELLRQLNAEKRDLERKLLNLSDMSPDSQFSLRVTKDNFDAKAWVAEMQNLKVQLANKQVELELATATSREWFTDTITVIDVVG